MKRNSSGQTVVEFVLVLLPLAAAVSAGSFVFHAEWNRLKCARLAFDAAHDALTGKTSLSAKYVSKQNGESVAATSQCGDAREKVVLFTVESGRW